MGKSTPQTPAAPNYAAAATAQGAANVDAARVAGQMNNPNIITPYGNQTVTWGQSQPDTQAYQKALADYNTKKGALGTAPTQAAFTTGGTPGTPGSGPTGTAPTQAQFTTPDTAAYQTALTAYNNGTGGALPTLPDISSFATGNPANPYDVQAYQNALADYQTGVTAYATNPHSGQAPTQDQFTSPDTAAYQAALAAYNAGGSAGTAGTGGTFNQVAYQAALDQYNQQLAGLGAAPTQSSYNLPGSGDQPTITQTLTPASQAALDAQQQVQQKLAGLAQQGITTAQGVLGSPFQYTGPNIQTSLPGQQAPNYGPAGGAYGSAQGFNPASYGQAGGINPGLYGQAGGISAGPNAQNALNLSGIAQAPVNAGMTGQNAILSRLQPQIQQNEQSLAQRLANQGIPQGSEAWDNAMRQQSQSENDLYTQAALQGIGVDLSANQQGYNQQLGQAGLYNAALGQNFGQGLQAQQLGNQAIGQNFGQGTSAQQLQNAAIAQNAGLGLQGVQAGNAAIGQNFGQGSTAAGLYNQAQNQAYNQILQSGQFGNTAAEQLYQRQLALYNQPLNQIAALMSGSQIQTPTFQPYQGQNVAAAPVFQGAQAQNQANQDIYGQQMAAYNANIQGLYGLLGSGTKAAATIWG